LLAHVKLWIFAECYGITVLEHLSLFKIHQALCAGKLNKASASLVVDAIGFVYANTRDTAKVKEVQLGELLVAYITCFADSLVITDEFRDLLRRGGDLASDFAIGVLSNS